MRKLSFGNKRIYVFSEEEEIEILEKICQILANADSNRLDTIAVLSRLRVPCENDAIAKQQLEYIRDVESESMKISNELLKIF